jgi:hypothetical protein
MTEASFQHDDAVIGLSWLTPQGRGSFALSVRAVAAQMVSPVTGGREPADAVTQGMNRDNSSVSH